MNEGVELIIMNMAVFADNICFYGWWWHGGGLEAAWFFFAPKRTSTGNMIKEALQTSRCPFGAR